MHKHRTKDSYHNYNKKLSETTKMKIGIKSKLKFNDDYNLRMREKMEALGYWYNNKDYEWNYYNRISNWIDNMFEIILLVGVMLMKFYFFLKLSDIQQIVILFYIVKILQNVRILQYL